MKKVLFIFLALCIFSTGCVTENKAEKLTNRIMKNTEILENLYQKHRRDKTLDAETEMKKVHLAKVLKTLNEDLSDLEKLYKEEPAYHINTMLISIPYMEQSVDDRDLLLFEQGYSTYMNGYLNFIDIVNE
ncbi:hypothetical protein [Bacillus sp. OAE603]|uniref:hypothetical protein n=1 Tax=Gottfriedia sp. OAE603 TaxID=2663872 RepID=UPI00178A6C32